MHTILVYKIMCYGIPLVLEKLGKAKRWLNVEQKSSLSEQEDLWTLLGMRNMNMCSCVQQSSLPCACLSQPPLLPSFSPLVEVYPHTPAAGSQTGTTSIYRQV